MQKTKWNIYHIPKNDEQNVEKIEKTEENLNLRNKKDYINTNKKTVNNEEEYNDDILNIPPHGTLSSAITKNFEINNEFKINLNKKDIEAMRKIGILSHSFDSNWEPKLLKLITNLKLI